MFRKYFAFFRVNSQTILAYRLNFWLGRLQNIILLLTLYFLWTSVFARQSHLLDYNQAEMLTYIIGGHFLRALILETDTKYVGEEIYSGRLSTVLLKPVSYFWQWLATDFSRKGLTVITSLAEAAVFVALVRPSLFIQTNWLLVGAALISILLAMLLNFVIAFTTGLLGFWTDETFSTAFLVEVIINLASGALFPLNILPGLFSRFLQILPFSFLLYFPLRIYLGKLTYAAVLTGLGAQLLWLLTLVVVHRFIWAKGLKRYAAYGG